VVGSSDLQDTPLPERITIHREINRARYLELLRGARIVVLPLLPTERATGQVVLLEAMSYGKPVITTRAPGTIDIVQHGINGFLVEPGDVNAINQLLDELIRDPEACARIGQQALSDVQRHHTTHTHTKERLNAITSLWGMQ
jgi:glycogen(starch) synthase